MERRLLFLDTTCLCRLNTDRELNQLFSRDSSLNHLTKDFRKDEIMWNEESIDILKIICLETDCQIVITDESKRRYSISDYEEMFALYGWKNPPIVGKTISFLGGGFLKNLEVADYLSYHPTMDFVIVDFVNRSSYRDYKSYAITVPIAKGLREEHIEEIIRLMLY